MRRTFHLVHGFNVRDGGAGTTDQLIPHFEAAGLRVRQQDYGWRGLLGVRFGNTSIARMLANNVNDGDIGVGHSNGCALLAEAADMGAPLRGLVLINPALRPDRVFACHLKFVHVYYSTGDTAVLSAKWLSWLPWNAIWPHPWGEMGRCGYTGNDKRVKNFNCGDHEHSELFTKLDQWAPQILDNLWAELPRRKRGAKPRVERRA